MTDPTTRGSACAAVYARWRPESGARRQHGGIVGSDGRTTSLHVAFWNTWLLGPRLWPGGPRLFADRFAPDVQRRAPLVGEALRGRFDVAALGEVFEPEEIDTVATAADAVAVVPGPGRTRRSFTSSGLATIVTRPDVAVIETNALAYRAEGDLRDSDTFANKGALHVRLRIGNGGPLVDLVSTHLFAGGGFFDALGAADSRRHHRVRVRQLRELVEFIAARRHDDAALLLVGDFNVAANDPYPALGSPTERYDEMASILEPLGVEDVWARHGIGAGHTCTFRSPADLPADPEEPDRVFDDGNPPVSGERIDYLWFAPPRSGTEAPAVGRPRRWAFPGRAVRGGPAGSLSDHLALSTTLTWNGRDRSPS